MCADYTILKVEPPTPSPMCYKYSYGGAHTLFWTNSLLKDVSQVQQREWEDEGDKGKLWLHKCETCEIYLPPLQLSLLFCENSQSFP